MSGRSVPRHGVEMTFVATYRILEVFDDVVAVGVLLEASECHLRAGDVLQVDTNEHST